MMALCTANVALDEPLWFKQQQKLTNGLAPVWALM
jgi:hypothetical protein